jgi:carbon monoxide dehydrogenase subunit G
MRLEDRFTISTPPDVAFERLLDLRSVGRCVPGGEVDEPDADGLHRGRVTVKLGPMRFAYEGTLRVVEADPIARIAIIEGAAATSGRGESARVRAVMEVLPSDAGALVRIETELEIRGRAAQMGSGIIGAVSKQMVKQTASCLEAQLGRSAEAGDAP